MRNRYQYHIPRILTGWKPAVLSIVFLLSNCQPRNSAKDELLVVSAKNNSSLLQDNFLIALHKTDIQIGETEVDLSNVVVFSGDQEIPSQHNNEVLYFMVDEIGPGAESYFTLKNGKSNIIYPKRTQAEISVKKGGHFEEEKYIGGEFENINFLRVPDEHTDHSFYIRYEGPGWESDLVGYRFYLDWRNATDVFGKKTTDMVLQQVGLDGFDSYHEMQDWGMDVLKVGSSLGVGSLGMYHNNKAVRVNKTDSVTCEIAENGPVYSAIKTNYYGWKVGDNNYDVESILSIHAGTRMTHHKIRISSQPENLCTGLGKDPNAKLYTDQGDDSKWGYLATYGAQSLNNDKLGLAVFFSNKHFKGFTEDEYSNIVKLIPISGRLDYYLMGAWEGEENGIKNEEEFMNYIKQTSKELAVPITVSIMKIN